MKDVAEPSTSRATRWMLTRMGCANCLPCLGVGLRQLASFDRDEFADWFRNEPAYWYKRSLASN